MRIERISIELTNRCSKGCAFCYNQSSTVGGTRWDVGGVVSFVRDCARHGVRAVSFGGGEPLEFDGVYDVLDDLRGVLFRSLTTNGLLLRDRTVVDRLRAAGPDKVHVSIHFSNNRAEVDRVIAQVNMLASLGIRSGINLLVARSQLTATADAAQRVRDAGIANERIVYLPMRGDDTPTAREVARVAGDQPFQSMSCLRGCARSERFCSIGWDQRVAWCSYTSSRAAMATLDYAGLVAALNPTPLVFCGGTQDG